MPIQDDGKSQTICVFVSIEYHSVTDGRTDRFADNSDYDITLFAYMLGTWNRVTGTQ